MFHIHTHVSAHFFGYYYVPISFISIMSTIRVLMYPGYLIKFPPAISLTWCVPVFWGLMSHTDLVFITFHKTGVLYYYMNNIVLVPTLSSKPFESRTISLHIPFPRTFFVFAFTRWLYLSAFPFVLQVVMFVMGCSFTISFCRLSPMTTSSLNV